MPWIHSYQSLANHPKTRRLARQLNITIPETIGHLHLIWWWALDYAPSGDLAGYDADDIAAAALWTGEPAQLVTALLGCGKSGGHGFLDATETGIVLHDWQDYAGRLLAQQELYRLANMRRQQEHRDRQRLPIFKRDDGHCRYCGLELTTNNFTIDHVIPTTRGGADTPDNKVTACEHCNFAKGNRTPEEANMPLLSPRNALRADTTSPRNAQSPSRNGPRLDKIRSDKIRSTAAAAAHIDHEIIDPPLSPALQTYSDAKIGRVSKLDRQQVEQLVAAYTDDWIKAAIEEATASGARSIGAKLLQTICQRWQTDGFKKPRQETNNAVNRRHPENHPTNSNAPGDSSDRYAYDRELLRKQEQDRGPAPA